ncbi:hypothetical protein HYQ46_004967 [Verticillium longisporum]|uniref:Predicted protein n=1 Tax=Verticillium alfalfae (strain VaMs.102 / ATCC MYA-4576 / FGSC 10136) TaxID=526221 RepID=C9SZ01_VERA1|nr:predicted protein [Verticillium alfalfae VaMs.102]EEY24016.1 predicted protein [Verticillium alfalfae VaMs.102]KAG7146241.1 hypothetical protein HYQ46_004967 [Verticillium longisporum]
MTHTVGLDETTINPSAISNVWWKFTTAEGATTPKSGRYPNFVFAMLPRLKKKCEDLSKHGKALIVEYMHDFCDKKTTHGKVPVRILRRAGLSLTAGRDITPR